MEKKQYIAADAAYNRYREKVGNINFAGKPMPDFDELTEKQQEGWYASVAPYTELSNTVKTNELYQQPSEESTWYREVERKRMEIDSIRAIEGALRFMRGTKEIDEVQKILLQKIKEL